MNKDLNLQLELFSGKNNQPEPVSQIRNSLFLTRIRNFERIILVIIGIMATAVISFSLGVENGKKQNQAVIVKTPLPRAAKVESDKQLQQEQKQAFTIQLASYKTKSYAEKEAQILKNKGLNPIILTKGNYTVLCVGSFSNKETAQSLLSQLEKRYTGCRIRRL